jgi:predicted metal-dependent hydrolase
MAQTAHIDLKDGRRLDFDVRTSAKSRSVRLKLNAHNGLQVTAPLGIPIERVIELVASRSDWIAQRLAQFDEVRHLLSVAVPLQPQAFDLPALAESWCVEYMETRANTVCARTDRPGRIVVSGAVSNAADCHAALRRWLARRAKENLLPWLERTSQETGLIFSDVVLKSQRTRWGSCTRDGRISLNCKLLFLPRELVRYVLVHELCHTLEHNHSSRYWVLVRKFTPSVDVLHGRMRDAWKFVPAWAIPPRTVLPEL